MFSTVRHFRREMTPDELAAFIEEEERLAPIRAAQAERERQERRAAGIRQSAETRRRKAEIRARLAAAFPGAVFDVVVTPYGVRLSWLDGPSEDDVRIVEPRAGLSRVETPAGRAARVAAERLARRLLRSKSRPLMVARAVRRRALAYAIVSARRRLQSAQLQLEFV